ncbi:MAG TPA: hypothetical protein VKU94_06360 [Geobacterales bacterium]|nr:hypothetical protein [Geobacterales bacterium]
MRVKVFSHNDLDGCGCGVVANVAFGAENVSVEYCEYSEINDKVFKFITDRDYEKYDRIFITDISIQGAIAELIDKNAELRDKTNLIDHHATALPLAEKYEWCEVRVYESNLKLYEDDREKVLASGTSLFYKFLRNKHIPKMQHNIYLKTFAELVREYDSWEWHNVYKNIQPKRLNDLLYIIGREKFVERFSDNPNPIFTDLESKLLEIEDGRVNDYVSRKKQDVKTDFVVVGDRKYHIAYVFAEQNISLLGNAIAEECGAFVDFVAIIDIGRNKVSLRGVHDYPRLGVDVARHYGGGGHDRSAGFEFQESFSCELFKKIFRKEG